MVNMPAGHLVWRDLNGNRPAKLYVAPGRPDGLPLVIRPNWRTTTELRGVDIAVPDDRQWTSYAVVVQVCDPTSARALADALNKAADLHEQLTADLQEHLARQPVVPMPAPGEATPLHVAQAVAP